MASSAPNGSSINSTSASWASARRGRPAGACHRRVRAAVSSANSVRFTSSSSSVTRAALVLRHLAQLQREVDVAPHREPREQRRLLEHEPGAAVNGGVARDGRSRPARMLSNVLLPQPDAPSMHTNSPVPTVSDTSSSACTAPVAAVDLAHVGQHDRGFDGDPGAAGEPPGSRAMPSSGDLLRLDGQARRDRRPALGLQDLVERREGVDALEAHGLQQPHFLGVLGRLGQGRGEGVGGEGEVLPSW